MADREKGYTANTECVYAIGTGFESYEIIANQGSEFFIYNAIE